MPPLFIVIVYTKFFSPAFRPMNHFSSLLAHHGYLLVFLVVLGEALGLPSPAALALVAGGAAVAAGTLHGGAVLGLALTAMMLGDSILYVLGRYMGWALLGFICKLSVNPESCILRSAESFYKRGKITLLFAKFIPGVNSMAPPLAGSMKMRPQQFLQLDFAGAFLYVSTYIALGYLFRNFLAGITRGFQAASHVLTEALFIAALAYVGYKVWLFVKPKPDRVVPRVQVQELAKKLVAEGGGKILLVDVRSHGYYDSRAQRIKGSLRLEPNQLSEELKTLPRDRDIYLYCT
jgi:membrane protein DedA with SNARE-associated domain